MKTITVTLALPKEIRESLKKVALQTHKSLDEVVAATVIKAFRIRAL